MLIFRHRRQSFQEKTAEGRASRKGVNLLLQDVRRKYQKQQDFASKVNGVR